MKRRNSKGNDRYPRGRTRDQNSGIFVQEKWNEESNGDTFFCQKNKEMTGINKKENNKKKTYLQ